MLSVNYIINFKQINESSWIVFYSLILVVIQLKKIWGSVKKKRSYFNSEHSFWVFEFLEFLTVTIHSSVKGILSLFWELQFPRIIRITGFWILDKDGEAYMAS